jgi:hypothetical protein
MQPHFVHSIKIVFFIVNGGLSWLQLSCNLPETGSVSAREKGQSSMLLPTKERSPTRASARS